MSIDRNQFRSDLLQWQKDKVPLRDQRDLILKKYQMHIAESAIAQLARLALLGG